MKHLWAVIIWLFMAIWVVVPSSWFITPNQLEYKDDAFIFYRDINYLDSVVAKWTVEVRSRLCTEEDDGKSIYARSEDPATYRVTRELRECIPEDGDPFLYEVSRNVLFLGWLPMRRTTTTWSCAADKGQCVRITDDN